MSAAPSPATGTAKPHQTQQSQESSPGSSLPCGQGTLPAASNSQPPAQPDGSTSSQGIPTKATSTYNQTSTSPETQLAKIWASASTKTHQEDTDTMLTYYIKTNYRNVLIQHCTVLYPITNVLKVVRCAICISCDLKAASQHKMGKGGMHNPISHNCSINPCYNFTTISNI